MIRVPVSKIVNSKDSLQTFDSVVINRSDIKEVKSAKDGDISYIKIFASDKNKELKIVLKPNNHFKTVSDFFLYIHQYIEICFETDGAALRAKARRIEEGDVFVQKAGPYNTYLTILSFEGDSHLRCLEYSYLGILFCTANRESLLNNSEYVGNYDKVASFNDNFKDICNYLKNLQSTNSQAEEEK